MINDTDDYCLNDDVIYDNCIDTICTHAEEAIGTELFLKLTKQKLCDVHSSRTFKSTVMYLNQNRKLRMDRNYTTSLYNLRSDEWYYPFIISFVLPHPDCKAILGVLTNEKDLNWYIDFTTAHVGAEAIERNGESIVL